MIAFHASAVCRVRDGYTGRPLEGASLLCALDGAPVRPLAKPGGYLILLNLSQGPHRLALRCHGYQEEWVDFPVEGGTLEICGEAGGLLASLPLERGVNRLDVRI